VNEFIAIDFETAMYAPSSAISIGLVKYRDYKVIDTFYSLIRPPELYVRPDFTAIHGLTVDDVRDAPDFGRIWDDKLRGFIGTLPLAAHNAPFDMKVLRATLEHYGVSPPRLRYFCSLALARRAWPGLNSHALAALGRKFNIIYDAHNALADAQTCGKIISLCLAERPIAITEALLELGIRMRTLTTNQT